MPQDNGAFGIMGNNFKMSGFIAVDGSAYHFVNFYWFFQLRFSFLLHPTVAPMNVPEIICDPQISLIQPFFRRKSGTIAHLVEHIAFDKHCPRLFHRLGLGLLLACHRSSCPWSTVSRKALRPLRFFWDGTQDPGSSHLPFRPHPHSPHHDDWEEEEEVVGGRNTLIMVFNQWSLLQCCILILPFKCAVSSLYYHTIFPSTLPLIEMDTTTIIKVIHYDYLFLILTGETLYWQWKTQYTTRNSVLAEGSGRL